MINLLNMKRNLVPKLKLDEERVKQINNEIAKNPRLIKYLVDNLNYLIDTLDMKLMSEKALEKESTNVVMNLLGQKKALTYIRELLTMQDE
jgi:hypothetical protein